MPRRRLRPAVLQYSIMTAMAGSTSCKSAMAGRGISMRSVPNRLFHQEPDGTFQEVPNAGGLNGAGYSMGVAIGDYNNEGLPDVFITRLRPLVALSKTMATARLPM